MVNFFWLFHITSREIHLLGQFKSKMCCETPHRIGSNGSTLHKNKINVLKNVKKYAKIQVGVIGIETEYRVLPIIVVYHWATESIQREQ